MLMQKIRLGDLLVKYGKITKEQLQEALEEQKKLNKRLGEILVLKGFITEEDLVRFLSKQLNIPIVDLFNESINYRLIKKIPFNIIEKFEAFPIKETRDSYIVVFNNPLDINAHENIQKYLQNKPIKPVISLNSEIKKIIQNLKNAEAIKNITEAIKKELSGQNTNAETSATMQLIEHIIIRAINSKASDIHIEATEDNTSIRFRIDGILHEDLVLERELFAPIASRIKLLARLNISERRKPQDGRFSMKINNQNWDFRISTLPIATGESIVIRILDKSKAEVTFKDLGISQKNLMILNKALSSPNGMILVTGPTGSGKTTTLYAALNKIRSLEKKIITVEDPVEYKMKLIQQVQVDEKAGLTFSEALKAILRQDPDIVMIGEIRDSQTLDIAMKAALTGHLVLSTLHTNDAISTIDRMKDLGIESYMIASATRAIQAQRLVRKVCENCKIEYTPDQAIINELKKQNIVFPPNQKFYKGEGCKECNMTGYKGREVISEVLYIDTETAKLISKNTPKDELLVYLKANGFEPMLHDGLIKVLRGITTLEEVYKVATIV